MFDDNISIIGVKELHTNLKSISKRTAKGEEFLVFKNTKPLFKIIPVIKMHGKKSKIYRRKPLEEFAKLKFHGGSNLSQEIDDILYNE